LVDTAGIKSKGRGGDSVDLLLE